jgi:hypothetical protein
VKTEPLSLVDGGSELSFDHISSRETDPRPIKWTSVKKSELGSGSDSLVSICQLKLASPCGHTHNVGASRLTVRVHGVHPIGNRLTLIRVIAEISGRRWQFCNPLPGASSW